MGRGHAPMCGGRHYSTCLAVRAQLGRLRHAGITLYIQETMVGPHPMSRPFGCQGRRSLQRSGGARGAGATSGGHLRPPRHPGPDPGLCPTHPRSAGRGLGSGLHPPRPPTPRRRLTRIPHFRSRRCDTTRLIRSHFGRLASKSGLSRQCRRPHAKTACTIASPSISRRQPYSSSIWTSSVRLESAS